MIDGQHRCRAVIRSNKSIYSWICRNAPADGIYDNNRKRSIKDQLTIRQNNLETIYTTGTFVPVARAILGKLTQRIVTPMEIEDLIYKHKNIIDGFFLNFKFSSKKKITIASVNTAMFFAYCAKVPLENIQEFYDILVSGISERLYHKPIIGYRDYLLQYKGAVSVSIENVGRAQYALKAFLSRSKAKKTMIPEKLIWEIPFQKAEEPPVIKALENQSPAKKLAGIKSENLNRSMLLLVNEEKKKQRKRV